MVLCFNSNTPGDFVTGVPMTCRSLPSTFTRPIVCFLAKYIFYILVILSVLSKLNELLAHLFIV